MLAQLWDKMRPDTRVVYSVAHRRRHRHVEAGALGLVICALLGASTGIVMLLAGLLLLCEALTEAGLRALPESDAEIRWPLMANLIAVCLISCTSFVAIGCVMISTETAVGMVAGLTMAVGTIAHVTIYYGSFPIYNHIQILPALAFLIACLSQVRDVALARSPDWQWAIAAVVVAIYIGTLLELRSQSRKVAIELARARRKANSRLRELEYHARHDSLTGLLTRAAFEQEIRVRLAADGQLSKAAVLVIDLDGFKPINDSYSHAAGDAVLREVANRLRRNIGETAILARFGGDEFVIVLPGLCDGEKTMQLAHAIMRDIARPIPWRSIKLSVTGAVGIAFAGEEGEDLHALLSSADQAMFASKAANDDQPIVFNAKDFSARPTLHDRAVLLEAIESGAIRPFYQPKMDMRSNQVFGFEALARWRHKDGQLRTPAEFLPMIDELGLQGALVHYMTERVLADMRIWVEQGYNPGQVSINIPEAVLATSAACASLIRALNEAPDLRDQVTLEITEDVFFGRASKQIRDTIRALRQEGYMISLDDFGTGFASFQHLRDLEFDEIKIDTSFVRALGQDRSSDILVKGLLAIAEGLNVQVIAEGVEEEFHKTRLLGMGCRIAQGFLWAPALPASDITILLQNQSATGQFAPILRSSAG